MNPDRDPHLPCPLVLLPPAQYRAGGAHSTKRRRANQRVLRAWAVLQPLRGCGAQPRGVEADFPSQVGRENPFACTLTLRPRPARMAQARVQDEADGKGAGAVRGGGRRAARAPRPPEGAADRVRSASRDEWKRREPATRPSDAGHRRALSPSLSLAGDANPSFPPYHHDDEQMLQATRRRPSSRPPLVTGAPTAKPGPRSFKRNGGQKA